MLDVDFAQALAVGVGSAHVERVFFLTQLIVAFDVAIAKLGFRGRCVGLAMALVEGAHAVRGVGAPRFVALVSGFGEIFVSGDCLVTSGFMPKTIPCSEGRFGGGSIGIVIALVVTIAAILAILKA